MGNDQCCFGFEINKGNFHFATKTNRAFSSENRGKPSFPLETEGEIKSGNDGEKSEHNGEKWRNDGEKYGNDGEK